MRRVEVTLPLEPAASGIARSKSTADLSALFSKPQMQRKS